MSSTETTLERVVGNAFYNSAMALAKQGISVIPVYGIGVNDKGDLYCLCGMPKKYCTSPGKHPVRSLVPNGLKNATTDPQTIKEWWTKCSWSNVAFATGEVSGVDVLDLDSKAAIAAIEEMAKNNGGMPATRAVETSKGKHIWFKHREGVKNRTNVIKGVDVRGDGGYALAPVSCHISGAYYMWEGNGNEPIAEWPDWLYKMILPPQELEETRKKRADVRSKVKPLEVSADGLPETSLYGIELAKLSGSRHRLALGAAAVFAECGISKETAVNTLMSFATNERDARQCANTTYANYMGGLKLKKFSDLPSIGKAHIDKLMELLRRDLSKLGLEPLPDETDEYKYVWFPTKNRNVFRDAGKKAELAKTAKTFKTISECALFRQDDRCHQDSGGCGVIVQTRKFVCKRDICPICSRSKRRDTMAWWDIYWPKDNNAYAIEIDINNDNSLKTAAKVRDRLTRAISNTGGKFAYKQIGPGKVVFAIAYGVDVKSMETKEETYEDKFGKKTKRISKYQAVKMDDRKRIAPKMNGVASWFGVKYGTGPKAIASMNVKFKYMSRDETIELLMRVAKSRNDLINTILESGDTDALANLDWAKMVKTSTTGASSVITNPDAAERFALAKKAALKRRAEEAAKLTDAEAAPCGCPDGGGPKRIIHELWKGKIYVDKKPWFSKWGWNLQEAISAWEKMPKPKPVPVG